MQQLNKIWILETVAFVPFRKRSWETAYNERVCILQTRHSLPPEDGGGYSSSDGDVSKVGYFFDIPASLKFKSLYSNDLILNSQKSLRKLSKNFSF